LTLNPIITPVPPRILIGDNNDLHEDGEDDASIHGSASSSIKKELKKII
jgi:hypothetical protein